MLKNSDISSGITYRSELLRKGIHLCSLSIPILYVYFDRFTAIKILAPMAILSIVIDVLSHFYLPARALMMTVFGKLLRPHETDSYKLYLNGASYVLLSALLCVALFPKIVMIASFSILIISDTAAALFGRRFGRKPFFDKSLEGAAAFALSAIAVIVVVGVLSGICPTFYIFGIIGAILGAIVESASIRLHFDDNLSIPLSVGGILLLGDWLSVHFLHQPSYLSILP